MDPPPETDLHQVNEALQQDIAALRAQNDQLWRIIEKQRTTIMQLQQQVQQPKLLSNEQPSQSIPSLKTTLSKEDEEEQEVSDESELTRTNSDELSPTKSVDLLEPKLTFVALTDPIPAMSPLLPSFNFFDEPTVSPTADVDEKPEPEQDVSFDDMVNDNEMSMPDENAQAEGNDSTAEVPSPLLPPTAVPTSFSSPPTSSSSSRPARKTFSVFIPPPAGPPPSAVLAAAVRPPQVALVEPPFLHSNELNPTVAPLISSLDELWNKTSEEWKTVSSSSEHVQSPQHQSYVAPASLEQPKLPPRPNSESLLIVPGGGVPVPPPHMFQKLSDIKLPTPPQLPPRDSQQPPMAVEKIVAAEVVDDDVVVVVPPLRVRTESEPPVQHPPTEENSEPNIRSQSHSVNSGKPSPTPEASGLLDELSIRVVGSTIKMNDKGREVLAFTFAVSKKRKDNNPRGTLPRELWRFEKFYSDFLAFDAKIKPALFETDGTAGVRKKLPDKSLFNNFAPNKVDQRKAGLEEYLCWILSVPALRQDYTVKEFLSSDVIPPATSGGHKSARGDRTEGYLTKKGKSFGQWKSRYFVIRDGLLHYYENKDGNHLGTVSLKFSKIGKQQAHADDDKEKATGYRHAFIILEPKNNTSTPARHVFCADSDEVRDEWVTSLAKVIDGKPLAKKRHQEQRRSNSGDLNLSSSNKRASREVTTTPDQQETTNYTPTNENVRNSGSNFRSPRSSAGGPPLSMSNMQQPNGPQAVIRGQEKPGSSSSSSRQAPVETESLFDEPQNARPKQKLMKGSGNAAITGPIFVERSHASSSRSTNNRLSVFNPPPGMIHGDKKNHHLRNRPAMPSEGEDSKLADKRRMTFFWGNKKENNLDLPAPSKPASAQKQKQDTGPMIVPNGGMVFGVPLEKSIARARVKEGYELPAVVYRAIEYLEAKNAYQEEGLYRLSGSTADIRNLRDRYNNNGDFDLVADKSVYHDVHAVAGLLKLYLRELPASVLTTELQSQFLHIMDLLDRRERIVELARLVSLLPLANYTLLRALVSHLIKVVSNSSVNKMTIRNIGIVFSPTLGIPAGIFALLMAEFEYIFWVGDSEEPVKRHSSSTSTQGTVKPKKTVANPPVESRSSTTSDTMREYAAAMGAGLEEIEQVRKAKVKAEKETRVETWVHETEPEYEIVDDQSAPAEVVEREKPNQNVVRVDESEAEGIVDLTIQASDPPPDRDLLLPPNPPYASARNSVARQSGDIYSLLTMYGDFNAELASPVAPLDTTAHLELPGFPLTVGNENRDSYASDASQKLMMYADVKVLDDGVVVV